MVGVIFSFVLALSPPLLPVAFPEEKEEEKGAPKKVSGSDEVPLVPFKLPPKGYARALRKLEEKEAQTGGLSATISVAPDAYRYYMAREMEDLERRGSTEDESKTKLRLAYKKYKVGKNKPLFFVSISVDKEATYLFQERLENHFSLRMGSEKGLSVVDTEPKLQFDTWRLFGSGGGLGRRLERKSLSQFASLKFEIMSQAALKPTDRTPINVTLKGILCQKRRADEKNSINVAQKQISFRDWNDIVLKDATVTFSPSLWNVPKAPEGFEESLKSIEKE